MFNLQNVRNYKNIHAADWWCITDVKQRTKTRMAAAKDNTLIDFDGSKYKTLF